jgi:hypothetical protein
VGTPQAYPGITLDVATKEVEIFKEGLPNVSRLAILQNPNYTFSTHIAQAMKNAAGRLQLTVGLFEALTANDLDRTFREIAQHRPDGLLITGASMFASERKRIAELALANHLPTMTWLNENTRSGLLMSYGVNVADLFRRSAFYVDKILRGAKPADLPVEQPTKFELGVASRTEGHINADATFYAGKPHVRRCAGGGPVMGVPTAIQTWIASREPTRFSEPLGHAERNRLNCLDEYRIVQAIKTTFEPIPTSGAAKR